MPEGVAVRNRADTRARNLEHTSDVQRRTEEEMRDDPQKADQQAVKSPLLLLGLVAAISIGATVQLSDARTEVEPWLRVSHAANAVEGEVQPVESLISADTVTLFSSTHPVLPPAIAALDDALLRSPMLYHPPFAEEVDRWVGRWSRNFSRWMPAYLERMTSFEDVVDDALAAEELPWSLRFLPVIESGYSPTAVSSAKAVGMWQFMAPTARDHGIEVSSLVDDRRDPFVSTAAAASYLRTLHADFDSWFLALAAYNAGPQRIRGLMQRYLPDEPPSDAVYWALREVLPEETRDFVPNFLGAVIVASDPVAFGYDAPEVTPFRFDIVPVRGAVSLETVARATGATRGEIERLNPEYLRGVTPPDREVELRLPVGTADGFRAYFADQPG